MLEETFEVWEVPMRFIHVILTFAVGAAAFALAGCSDDDAPAATPSATQATGTTVVAETPVATATRTAPAAAASPTTVIDERLKLRLITVATGDNRALDVAYGQGSGGAWSPNSTRLAVPGDNPSIIDVATGARTALWNVRCAGVAWSPSGAQVAAVCADGFIIVDSAGKLLQQDKTVPGGDLVKMAPWVRWSPDGKSVVYGASATAIRIMTTGGAQRAIAGAFVDARWVSDGRLVTVEQASYRDAATVRVLDPGNDFAVTSQFTSRPGAGPVAIDGNGRYVAYAVFGTEAKPGSRILPSTTYVVGLDSGQEVRAFADAYGPPDFSRDGVSVLMQRDYCGPNWALVIGTLDGGVRVVTPGGALVTKFSPDDSRVGFTRGKELWVAASDGASPARRIATEVHGPFGFEWSPDGKSITVPPYIGGFDQCN